MTKALRHGDGFSSLVRQVLVIEKRRSLRDVAEALGMDYANFHARVIGRTRFKPEEISALIREVPDSRLCDYLLRDTPFMAVQRPAPTTPTPSSGCAFHMALRLATESLAALEQIGDSLAEGHQESGHYDELAMHIQEAERAVCDLRGRMSSLAPRKAASREPRNAGTPLATVMLG